MQKNKKIKIICGHYGSGKTNVCVNLAMQYKKQHPTADVALADIDTVNPYFRAADNVSELRELGIRPIGPVFANTNVDIPSLPAELYSLFNESSDTVSFIDVGGDDGAAALGVYSELIEKCGYEMYYVVSCYRPLIEDPLAAADLMRIIEEVSHLKCTAVINNSSIGADTTKEDVIASLEYAERVSRECSLPLLFTSYYEDLMEIDDTDNHRFFPMKNVTKQLF